ncbi:MAG: DUF4118 domain-containing protein [Chthoniobacterales bacterium]|nr:DUF4118 domain-containing protein [Chthoniobacterales bacterium]
MPRIVLPAHRHSYAIALLAVAGSFLLKVALGSLIGANFSFVFLFAGVLVGAWFGGLGPGLFATGLSILSAIYFAHDRQTGLPADASFYVLLGIFPLPKPVEPSELIAVIA